MYMVFCKMNGTGQTGKPTPNNDNIEFISFLIWKFHILLIDVSMVMRLKIKNNQ